MANSLTFIIWKPLTFYFWFLKINLKEPLLKFSNDHKTKWSLTESKQKFVMTGKIYKKDITVPNRALCNTYYLKGRERVKLVFALASHTVKRIMENLFYITFVLLLITSYGKANLVSKFKKCTSNPECNKELQRWVFLKFFGIIHKNKN